MKNHQEWTVLKALRWTTTYFSEKKIENPRLQAELLLANALGFSRVDLYLNYDRPLSIKERKVYRQAIKERLQGVPLQFITGIQPFRHLILDIREDVFIPRPETEILVEKALEVITDQGKDYEVLDLGTGTGAVALSLAYEKEKLLVIASDISLKALILAKKNCRKYNLEDRVKFLQANFFKPIKEQDEGLFNIIISNPPYVPTKDKEKLPPEVAIYEPEKSIFGGEDGLDFLKHIILNTHQYLRNNGYILLEIGHDQAEAVKQIMLESAMYNDIEVFKDLANRDRVIRARRK